MSKITRVLCAKLSIMGKTDAVEHEGDEWRMESERNDRRF